jgi:hypothetical protein
VSAVAAQIAAPLSTAANSSSRIAVFRPPRPASPFVDSPMMVADVEVAEQHVVVFDLARANPVRLVGLSR